ncbi:MAG: hypothetical protein AAGF56_04625 [Pseudomonadota bacterium]
MGQVFPLESFDDDTPVIDPAEAAYHEGFTAGQAAGQAAAEADQLALKASLVQAIADLEFTYSEARGEMTRALAPVFQALVEKVLPHCIAGGFATQIASVISAHVAAGQTSGLSIIVHPSQRAAITAALGDDANRIAWGEDAALDVHAAWVGHAAGEVLINFDQLLDEISAILGALNSDDMRSDSNG